MNMNHSGGWNNNGAKQHFSKSLITKSIELTRASQIEPKPIDWLWHGYLAAGKFHILAGAAGTGKTNISLYMAATISNGSLGRSCWPDKSYAPQGNVIIWTGEDGIEDTIVPRLIALGANMDNVHVIQGAVENGRSRPFDFAKDLEELSQEIARVGKVMLVIIDSIVQAVAGDSNKNSEVRRGLAPLIEIAEYHNFAVLGISHLTKGSKAKDPLDRVAGSLAFGAVARVVMITAKIKTESSTDMIPSCVLVRAKANIERDDGGFEYRIESAEFQAGTRTISTSRICWNDTPLQGSAREILKFAETDDNVNGKPSKVDEAAEFLIGNLANGPLPFPEIESRANAAGIKISAIQRAKLSLGIRSEKQSGIGQVSPYFWYLAESSENSLLPTGYYPPYNHYAAPAAPATSVLVSREMDAESAAPEVHVAVVNETGASPALPATPAPVAAEMGGATQEQSGENQTNPSILSMVEAHMAKSSKNKTFTPASAAQDEVDSDDYNVAYHAAFSAARAAAYGALVATGDIKIATDSATKAAYEATNNDDAADDAIFRAVNDALNDCSIANND